MCPDTTLVALEAQWVATLAGFPSLSYFLLPGGELFRLHGYSALNVAMYGMCSLPQVLQVLWQAVLQLSNSPQVLQVLWQAVLQFT